MTVLKSWGGGRVEEGWIHKDVRGTNPSARMQEITDEIAGPPSLRKEKAKQGEHSEHLQAHEGPSSGWELS